MLVNATKAQHNSFVPQFITTGLPLHTRRFINDGVTPHTANTASDFLHDTFGPSVISHTHTAHHRLGKIGHPTDWTPHINLCDFFWAYVKGMPIPIISHKSVGPKWWNVRWTYRGYVPMSDHKHSGLCFFKLQARTLYILSMWAINH